MSTVAYLDSERFTKLFADLEALAGDPPLTEAAGKPAAEVAGPLAAGPWEKLRKGVRALPRDPPDAQLHRIRILAKRARYAAQAVEPAVGEPAHAYAAAAAELQTILGEHQDAVTTEAWLAAAAQGHAAFVVGRLAGLERAKAIEMRGRWREAWKTLSAPELRAWMEPT